VCACLLRRFQTALKKYGVPEEEIFQTADLYERRNIPQVTLCLYALSRLVCHKHKCAHATSALAGDYFFTRETIRPMRSGWSYGGIAQFCSSFYFFIFFDGDVIPPRRRRSIQNTRALAWDPRWPTRMNASSPRSNYVLTRDTSDSRPDLTKEPPRPASEDSETPDTCEKNKNKRPSPQQQQPAKLKFTANYRNPPNFLISFWLFFLFSLMIIIDIFLGLEDKHLDERLYNIFPFFNSMAQPPKPPSSVPNK
jgi:hypothetical protein